MVTRRKRDAAIIGGTVPPAGVGVPESHPPEAVPLDPMQPPSPAEATPPRQSTARKGSSGGRKRVFPPVPPGPVPVAPLVPAPAPASPASPPLDSSAGQARELTEELRQTRQQCRQLQEELQTANRDFQAFKQQFQEFRQEFQQTQGDFQRERVAFHQEVQATRHELDQAQAACRQENAAILELKQRALAANHDLGQTYKRMRDIDQSLESTWERLSKQMDEQQRLVEHEAETATRLVEARLDEFLEKLRDCERQEVEARERAHHQPGRPTVLIEHNTMVPMEGSTHLGLTVDAEAQILEVAPDTPAQRAGLHPGDVVVKVDSRPINTGEDLREALEHAEAGKELSLTVARKLEAIETKDVVPELALS